jgi:NAD+ synthase
MVVTGYPIEDLAESAHFVREAENMASYHILPAVAQMGYETAIIFGGMVANGEETKPSNVAFFFDPKTMQRRIIRKYELPNYGVFDEKRIFEPANLDTLGPLQFRGQKIGIMVCEDMWWKNVTAKMIGADTLIAINGSPFEVGKNDIRIEHAIARMDQCHAKEFIYVNMVGGQDELVFDGASFAIKNVQGVACAKQFPSFEEKLYIYDSEKNTVTYSRSRNNTNVEDIYKACVLGTRDYLRKCGFKSAVIGMSGGVDSGIVAAIAADAIGADRVNLVRLPSNFSSSGSLIDAATAAEALGCPMRTIAIEPVVNAIRAAYSGAEYASTNMEKKTLAGVADENIQARARGNILMAISNQENHILLTTGNKSEVSVGYATIYGDACGGYNPIKDCYKTTVFEMCRYRNSLTEDDLWKAGFFGNAGEVIPETIINKPPSAELRPDQKDEDSLPPYPVLDAILKGLIEDRKSVAQVTAIGYNEADVKLVRGLIDKSEYKRRQAAPGVKITNKLHGKDRRVPIVNHFSV